jgi:hypothetical protein
MFRKKITLAFLMGCLCSMGGHAQDDREPLKLEPAYLLGAETVYFKPLVPMDWQDIARKNFKQFDLDHPDRKEIQRHYVSISGESPFFYSAPLPRGTKSGFYYIFYSGGVVSITLTELAGTIVYRVTPTFSGMVVARAPGPGFVVMSDTPRAVEKTLDLPLVNGPNVPGISAQTRPGNIDYVYTDEQGRHTVMSGLCHTVRMAPIKTYLATFVADPTRYVFIVWGDKGMKPQEGRNFNLITIDPEGRVKWIRSNPCEQPPSL